MKNKPLLSSHPEVAAQSEFVIFPWGIFPHTQFFIFVLKSNLYMVVFNLPES